ncbi:MAG TPA: YncE family protein, partial [Chitinophagaceae bacterium]|nr:YncE family protein [Chitinophagaceae bacterium]
MMKQIFIMLLAGLLFIQCPSCKGQKNFGDEALTLKNSIPLPHVSGRIDHMDINLSKQLLYVAALGNNSLETVDIQNGRTVHSVQNLDEPQGVAYITSTNEVFVANGGNGICCFY